MKRNLSAVCFPGVPFSAVLASGDAVARQRAREAMTPLLDALGHMMLRGGCFHADPHAGNLLLQVCASAALVHCLLPCLLWRLDTG